MIDIQGHTSAECQNMYSGLKPGTVHHQATAHYDRFAGAIPCQPLTAPRSPLSRASLFRTLTELLSWFLSRKPSMILLKKTTLNSRHLSLGLPSENESRKAATQETPIPKFLKSTFQAEETSEVYHVIRWSEGLVESNFSVCCLSDSVCFRK